MKGIFKILSVSLALIMIVGCAKRYPSDESLKSSLSAQKKEFERFVLMLDEDQCINRISPGNATYYSEHSRISDARYSDYRALFSTLGTCESATAWREKEQVYVFYFWNDGVPLESRCKGIAYFRSPPNPAFWRIVANLDTRPPGKEDGHYLVPIDAHWFLYYR